MTTAEDDVVVPVAGIVDVADRHGFVRTSGYLPGPDDVYVSPGQLKRYGLRRGDLVVGTAREGQAPQGNARRDRHNPLVHLDSVNGVAVVEYLAIIAAWVGEKDLAFEQLETAVRLPNTLSYGQLKLLPYWDPLRGDPRFEKIVNSLAPKL